MKLNRQNKAILKSLDGEYKKFGNKVKSAVFAHCKGEDAVNDTLCDMFGMLAEAQREGRPLGDVIPDESKTIRDTVACLPLKKVPHTRLIWGIFAGVVAAAAIAAFLWSVFAPLPVGDLYFIRYDMERGRIYWNDVSYATRFDVKIDHHRAEETDYGYYYATLGEGEHKITVTAYGEGRHSKPVTYTDYIFVDYPSIAGGICDFEYTYGTLLEEEDFSPFLQIKSSDYFDENYQAYTISFTPEISFFGRYAAQYDWVVTELTSGGRTTRPNSNSGNMKFEAGTTYTFSLSGGNEGELFMEIGLLKASVLPDGENVYNTCTPGQTLFSLTDLPQDVVYRTDNAALGLAAYTEYDLVLNIQLREYKKLYDNVSAAFADEYDFDGWSTTYYTRYLLVQNDSEDTQYLNLSDVAATEAGTRGTIEMDEGYTVVNFAAPAPFKNAVLAMYSDSSYIYDTNRPYDSRARVVTGISESSTYREIDLTTDFFTLDYEGQTTIVFYNEEPTVYAYSILNEYESDDESYNHIEHETLFAESDTATITLKPGITMISSYMWRNSYGVAWAECMLLQSVTRDEDGSLISFGFIDNDGVDFDDVFSKIVTSGYLVNTGDSDIILRADNMSYHASST